MAFSCAPRQANKCSDPWVTSFPKLQVCIEGGAPCYCYCLSCYFLCVLFIPHCASVHSGLSLSLRWAALCVGVRRWTQALSTPPFWTHVFLMPILKNKGMFSNNEFHGFMFPYFHFMGRFGFNFEMPSSLCGSLATPCVLLNSSY